MGLESTAAYSLISSSLTKTFSPYVLVNEERVIKRVIKQLAAVPLFSVLAIVATIEAVAYAALSLLVKTGHFFLLKNSSLSLKTSNRILEPLMARTLVAMANIAIALSRIVTNLKGAASVASVDKAIEQKCYSLATSSLVKKIQHVHINGMDSALPTPPPSQPITMPPAPSVTPLKENSNRKYILLGVGLGVVVLAYIAYRYWPSTALSTNPLGAPLLPPNNIGGKMDVRQEPQGPLQTLLSSSGNTPEVESSNEGRSPNKNLKDIFPNPFSSQPSLPGNASGEERFNVSSLPSEENPQSSFSTPVSLQEPCLPNDTNGGAGSNLGASLSSQNPPQDASFVDIPPSPPEINLPQTLGGENLPKRVEEIAIPHIFSPPPNSQNSTNNTPTFFGSIVDHGYGIVATLFAGWLYYKKLPDGVKRGVKHLVISPQKTISIWRKDLESWYSGKIGYIQQAENDKLSPKDRLEGLKSLSQMFTSSSYSWYPPGYRTKIEKETISCIQKLAQDGQPVRIQEAAVGLLEQRVKQGMGFDVAIQVASDYLKKPQPAKQKGIDLFKSLFAQERGIETFLTLIEEERIDPAIFSLSMIKEIFKGRVGAQQAREWALRILGTYGQNLTPPYCHPDGKFAMLILQFSIESDRHRRLEVDDSFENWLDQQYDPATNIEIAKNLTEEADARKEALERLHYFVIAPTKYFYRGSSSLPAVSNSLIDCINSCKDAAEEDIRNSAILLLEALVYQGQGIDYTMAIRVASDLITNPQKARRGAALFLALAEKQQGIKEYLTILQKTPDLFVEEIIKKMLTSSRNIRKVEGWAKSILPKKVDGEPEAGEGIGEDEDEGFEVVVGNGETVAEPALRNVAEQVHALCKQATAARKPGKRREEGKARGEKPSPQRPDSGPSHAGERLGLESEQSRDEVTDAQRSRSASPPGTPDKEIAIAKGQLVAEKSRNKGLAKFDKLFEEGKGIKEFLDVIIEEESLWDLASDENRVEKMCITPQGDLEVNTWANNVIEQLRFDRPEISVYFFPKGKLAMAIQDISTDLRDYNMKKKGPSPALGSFSDWRKQRHNPHTNIKMATDQSENSEERIQALRRLKSFVVLLKDTCNGSLIPIPVMKLLIGCVRKIVKDDLAPDMQQAVIAFLETLIDFEIRDKEDLNFAIQVAKGDIIKGSSAGIIEGRKRLFAALGKKGEGCNEYLDIIGEKPPYYKKSIVRKMIVYPQVCQAAQEWAKGILSSKSGGIASTIIEIAKEVQELCAEQQPKKKEGKKREFEDQGVPSVVSVELAPPLVEEAPFVV